MLPEAHTPTGTPPRVLVVDDEFLIAMDVSEVLREMGFEVIGPANDLRAATRLMRQETPDLAVVDLNLGRGVGGETLVRLLEAHGCRCLVLSGDDERCRSLRERFPLCQVVVKPSPQRRLKSEVDRLARSAGLRPCPALSVASQRRQAPCAIRAAGDG